MVKNIYHLSSFDGKEHTSLIFVVKVKRLEKMQNKEDKGENRGQPVSDELFGSNSQIANQLRAFYTSIQEEEIPDRFLDLLEQLDEIEMNGQAKGFKGE